jgi:thioredoxin-dependent peroxiredoxin
MTTERMNATYMKGEPLTLVGKKINAGDQAPAVDLTDSKLAPLEFTHIPGKTCILTSVPSLDTSVCDKEIRYFNKAALKFDDVEVVTVSMDLPFAQSRWCESSKSDNITAYSDHREASFGKAYGVLIKELRLLSRAVFLIDKEGIIRYSQYIPEITDQPDYDDVLSALESL